MRAYKTVNDAYIEPISFVVPRRAEVFQSDIYPPATGLKPGVSGLDWLSGKTALPPKIDLESIYEGNAPVEVPSESKPLAAVPAPAPAKAPSPVKKEPEPALAAQRAPPPTISQQKGSIAEMASKFQDNEDEEEEDDEDSSSFEEISKPIIRAPAAAAKPQPKPTSPITARPVPITSVSPSKPVPCQAPAKAATAPLTSSVSSSASNSLVDSLEQIKSILEYQTKTITAQSEKIEQLTAEVDTMKKKIGSGSSDQSERIRQLELELEAARS
jgi:coronin-1B/1C/6